MKTQTLRRDLYRSDQYHRHGFGHQADVSDLLKANYQSHLIQQMRNNKFRLTQGNMTIRLAAAFGFCWGVERSIAMVYETRHHFPNQQLWITNELIHNPSVNQHLRQMQVNFVPVQQGSKDFSNIQTNDVVILPAFGASAAEMQVLKDKGCTIVDATCPWVSKVWNSVEKHKKSDFTSIIHGKHRHEETIATSSFAQKYLIVLNLEEAEYVCNYILNKSESVEENLYKRREFEKKFHGACSQDFNPDTNLEHIGIANQTTMLKSETAQIGKLFEHTIIQKYGSEKLNQHFLAFNTICDATQERQEAMLELVQEPLDLILVIGGFNSSNTSHLLEIAIKHAVPAYHIDSAERISAHKIEHKPIHQYEAAVTDNWLPSGSIILGVTAGASTPDRVVEEVIEKVFSLSISEKLV